MTRETRPSIVSEAGGVVVRLEDGAPRYLLVTAKDNPRHWLFPKGHVEPGESPAEAAVREVREEAGVRGRVLGPLGPIDFEHDGKALHVQFFLIEHLGTGPAAERRDSGWFPYEDALARLTFDDTRRILRSSQPTIAALVEQRQTDPRSAP